MVPLFCDHRLTMVTIKAQPDLSKSLPCLLGSLVGPGGRTRRWPADRTQRSGSERQGRSESSQAMSSPRPEEETSMQAWGLTGRCGGDLVGSTGEIVSTQRVEMS